MSTTLHTIKATDTTLDVIAQALEAATEGDDEFQRVLGIVREWQGKDRIDPSNVPDDVTGLARHLIEDHGFTQHGSPSEEQQVRQHWDAHDTADGRDDTALFDHVHDEAHGIVPA